MHKLALCSPLRNWSGESRPLAPFVSLAVGAHVLSDGRAILTGDLMTDSEIDGEVEALIAELEEFRRDAKKELHRLRARMARS